MNSYKQKLRKNPDRSEVEIGAGNDEAADGTLDVPKFLVRLVGRDNVKHFSVPIIIRNRHD